VVWLGNVKMRGDGSCIPRVLTGTAYPKLRTDEVWTMRKIRSDHNNSWRLRLRGHVDGSWWGAVGGALVGRGAMSGGRVGHRVGQIVAFLAIAAFVAGIDVQPANASPFELYGSGARGSAMGSAMSAQANSADALFYNPAALTRARSGVMLGMMVAFDQAQILMKDRPEGYDIPDIGTSNPTIPSSQTIEARTDVETIGTLYTITIGGVSSLGTQKFRVAALGTFPLGSAGASSTHFSDERERLFSNRLHHTLVGDRVRRFTLDMGLAYQLTSRISLGFGASMLPSVKLSNAVYIPSPTDQRRADINLTQRQGFTWGVGGGALVEVTDYLRVAAAYRHRVGFEIDGRNEIQIRGLDPGDDEYPVRQELLWVPASSPSIATIGAAVDAGRATISMDLRYTVWSQYRDSQGEETGFVDRISPRVGMEYRYSPSTDVRFGLGYEESPVPPQDGRTNYVDNSRLIGAFGASHRFEVMSRDLEVSWYLQYQRLFTRDEDKRVGAFYVPCGPNVTELCDEVRDDLVDARTGQSIPAARGLQTENPGFPGWVSGGWLAAIGVELAWRF